MSMVFMVSVINCLLLVWLVRLLHSKDPYLHFLQTDVLSTLFNVPFNAQFDDFHSPYLGYVYTTIQRLCHALMYPKCSSRAYMREADAITKVCTIVRWRLNIRIQPLILLIDILSMCDLCLALE